MFTIFGKFMAAWFAEREECELRNNFYRSHR